jgi:hypothetical protein
MNKNLVIGLVVVAGIGIYLYNRRKKSSADANFSNFVSRSGAGNFQVRSNAQCGGCPPNSQCMEVTFPNGNRGMRCVDLQAGTIVK